MRQLENSASGNKVFFSSNKNQAVKMRVYSWIGLILAGVYVSINHFSMMLVGVMLVIGLFMDWILRKHLQSGCALVTLSDHSIESPNMLGPLKSLRWVDIEKITIETVQGTRTLSFLLKASTGIPDKRQFWTGVNARKPSISLAPFSELDQEQLLDETRQRLAKVAGYIQESSPLIPNELRQEREFQEKLKTLKPHTWATYALIAVNVLIWLAGLSDGAAFTNTPAQMLYAWGGNAASAVQSGQWWRLLSATFLHSGYLHIMMNMLGLYTAGVIVERIYGSRLFLIIYFGSALLGSALSLHFSAQQVVSVGASGAVFGVAGAMVVAVLQHRSKLPDIFRRQTISGTGFFIGYSLLQGFSHSGIDNAAHIGGLLGGGLIAFVLPERFDLDNFRRIVNLRAACAFVLVCIATVSLAAMAPVAMVDQEKVFASERIFSQAAADFELEIKALQQEEARIIAGEISALDADNRSRTVYAPVFQRIAQQLAQVVLRPNDPREQFLRDIRRVSELFAEVLAMESVYNPDTKKYEPADAARASVVNAELMQSAKSMEKFIKAQKQ